VSICTIILSTRVARVRHMTQNDPITPIPARNLAAHSRGHMIWSNSLLTVGSLVALCSFCCAAEMIVEICGGNMHLSGSVAALLFFVGITVGGAVVVRAQLKNRRALKELNQEQCVLGYAKAEKGRGLTVSEISLTCSLNIGDTAAVINRLLMRGVCQVDVSDEGELIYAFSCFSKQIEKNPDK